MAIKTKITAAALCAAMIASGSVYAMAADGSDAGEGAALTAAPTAAAQQAASFSDVPSGIWYETAVKYVNEKGLFSGTAADKFSPNVNMSRGMFVTVLGRAAGVSIDAAQAQTGFSDVDASKYYAPYIKWASDNGIVTGTGNGKFSPDVDVSREQMCSILVRFIRDYKKIDISAYTAGNVQFSDAATISGWARADVSTAQSLGLVQGSQDGSALKFDPAGKTTRAAAAAVFMRLDTKLAELQNGSQTPTEPITPTQPGNTENGGAAGGGGGGSTGGNTGGNDNKPTDEQIQDEKEVAGYLQTMSAKYHKSTYITTVSKPVQEAMSLLMTTIDKVLAERENGVFVSPEYIKKNYGTEVEEFRAKYHALTETQTNEIQNVAIGLETEAHIYYVMSYFGIKDVDLDKI